MFMRVEVLRPKVKKRKLRVCAYCRVSTDDAEQSKSFFAQIEHLGNFVKQNPEWEFAGVFADEAVSGSGITQRTDFLKMMEECRKGNIDRIITKSISRFTRNTTDMLEAIRELKSLGISVFFEKENIDTMKSEGELMLTVLSSFAQEELRNTSENIRWGIRRMFEDGRVMIDTNRFMG
jgi:DNA invertase Pin-like site-specific DNA recombinase